MHHPTGRIIRTTAFVTPVVDHWLEREIAQWVHPMKGRSDDPSHHERTLLPRKAYEDNKRILIPKEEYGNIISEMLEDFAPILSS